VGVCAFLGAYLKQKGANKALDEDIKHLTGKVEEIKTTYVKQIEDYKIQLSNRSKAAKVAEFLTENISPNPDYVKLNGYAMDLSLWLPTEIYRNLGRCICHEDKAPTPKQILIEVRKYLLKDAAGDLKHDDIIHFPFPNNNAEQNGSV